MDFKFVCIIVGCQNKIRVTILITFPWFFFIYAPWPVNKSLNFRIPILPFANVVSNLNLIESFLFQSGSLICNTLRVIKSYVRTREHHRTTGISMIYFKASRKPLPKSVLKMFAHNRRPLKCERHYWTKYLPYKSNGSDAFHCNLFRACSSQP